MQDMYSVKSKPLYLALVNPEKLSARMLWFIVLKLLWKQEIDEWLMRAVQGMYRGAVNKVNANNEYCNEFSMQIRVLSSIDGASLYFSRT